MFIIYMITYIKYYIYIYLLHMYMCVCIYTYKSRSGLGFYVQSVELPSAFVSGACQ